MLDKASQSFSDPGLRPFDLQVKWHFAGDCLAHRLCPLPSVWPELATQGFGTLQLGFNIMVTADRGHRNQQALNGDQDQQTGLGGLTTRPIAVKLAFSDRLAFHTHRLLYQVAFYLQAWLDLGISIKIKHNLSLT